MKQNTKMLDLASDRHTFAIQETTGVKKKFMFKSIVTTRPVELLLKFQAPAPGI